MKKYWLGIFGQVNAFQRRFVRDKVALFFTFLFPLIFLFVFGSIFSNQTVSFRVVILNHSDSQFAKSFVEQAKSGEDSPLKVENSLSEDEAKEKMKRSEIDGILELGKEFGQPDESGRPNGTVNVLYQKGSEQAGQTLTALMEQVTQEINKGMGQPEPPLKVAAKAIGDESLKQFDYTFTGLLAFSLMSMGVFGLSQAMPTEKQKGSYRRLRAAPFTSGQLVIATGIHYVIISLLSVLSLLIVGLLVFNFHMRGDWLVFSLFTLLASVLTVGFGLFIGSWAKNESQAAPLSNLVAFPMMFLSGAFFPIFLFPGWLQQVSTFIPLTPVVDGFRLIMAENASLIDVAPQIGLISIWLIIVYALAIKLFRWE